MEFEPTCLLQIVGKRQWSRQSLESAFERFAEDAEILALQQELQQIMQRSVLHIEEAANLRLFGEC